MSPPLSPTPLPLPPRWSHSPLVEMYPSPVIPKPSYRTSLTSFFVPCNSLTSPSCSSLPRSIQSSHLFLLAFTILIVSTIQTILWPTTATSVSDAKLPPYPALHALQDEFTSLATPVLDSIDSISSPAVIIFSSLIVVGTLVRGAENALRSLAIKGRC